MPEKTTHTISWNIVATRSIDIEASSPEEAWNKWNNGDFDVNDLMVDDEDMAEDYVLVDGEAVCMDEYKPHI